MQVIAVDDEMFLLKKMVQVLHKLLPEEQVQGFEEGEEAISYAQKEKEGGRTIDVAFLDIELAGMTGIELAMEMKKIFPRCNVIFVTGFSQYALQALNMHCSGYLLKPVSEEDVRRELDNLRLPIEPVEAEHRVRIQTFGNFEIFVDDVPVKFKRGKSKEILAYLVDRRGAMVNNGEILAVIWEDRSGEASVKKQLQVYIADIMKSLEAVGAKDIIIKEWKKMGINPSKVDCDYYQFMSGDVHAVNQYGGEYMSNYSWAEMTLGILEEHANKK